jgi:hypothetical protein
MPTTTPPGQGVAAESAVAIASPLARWCRAAGHAGEGFGDRYGPLDADQRRTRRKIGLREFVFPS